MGTMDRKGNHSNRGNIRKQIITKIEISVCENCPKHSVGTRGNKAIVFVDSIKKAFKIIDSLRKKHPNISEVIIRFQKGTGTNKDGKGKSNS